MILYIKIEKSGKIRKEKEKSLDCVEYDTEKINESEYIKELARKIIDKYESIKKIKRIEYKPAKEFRAVYIKENTEPAYSYTSRCVVGIIKKNEKDRKQMEILKSLIK